MRIYLAFAGSNSLLILVALLILGTMAAAGPCPSPSTGGC